MKTFSKRALLRASAAPAILGASLIATAAFAQEAPQAAGAEAGDTIIVTGSLIRNPNLASSSPVNVTTADEIDLQQANVAEELLREIPGIVPSIGSAVNNGNGGFSFVNLRGLGSNRLRGLGSNRNVVLLDGVRVVPAELNGRFDLNNVPLALIERVEVLTGGASTTYGADAISGVVNFITKSDFSGFEANLANQITDEGDGHTVRFDVTTGANFDDGRGNVVLGIGYQQSDPVYQGARKIGQNTIGSISGQGAGSGTSIPSRFSFPGSGTFAGCAGWPIACWHIRPLQTLRPRTSSRPRSSATTSTPPVAMRSAMLSKSTAGACSRRTRSAPSLRLPVRSVSPLIFRSAIHS
nr:TonB-dependent receptor plug domain-containing protein [Sphingobium sp. Ant17]